MTSKKKLVIVTGVLSFISILTAIVFNYLFKIDFLSDFSFAILGSSLLGFIMSMVEYFVEKNSALEEYYSAALNLISVYSKAKYFIMNEPKELLIAYYNELQTIVPKRYSFEEPTYPAKDKLFKCMNDIWTNTIDIPESEFSEYANRQFDIEIKKYNKELKDTISSYLTISETSISALENAYGKLDFIFGNQKFRAKIYENIHNPLKEYKRFIDEKGFYFRTFMNAKKSNPAVMIDMIDEIQKKYYRTIDKSNEYLSVTIVYRQFIDDMNDKLEWLRCEIYHDNYSPLEHVPFVQYQRSLKLYQPPAVLKK